MAKRAVAVREYSPRYHTLAHEFLDMEREEGFGVTSAEYELLDAALDYAQNSLVPLPGYSKPEAIAVLKTIDNVLTGQGLGHQRGVLISEGLRIKKINCHVRSCIYKSIADLVHLPLKMAIAPGHVYVRWENGETNFNWETTSGREATDKRYIDLFKIVPEAIQNKAYLRSLNDEEAKAVQYNHQGVIWKRRGQISKAIKHFRKALDLDSWNPLTHNNMGAALIKIQDLKRAITFLTQAIEIDPGFVTAYENRSKAWHRLGKEGKAIDDSYKALELQAANIPQH